LNVVQHNGGLEGLKGWEPPAGVVLAKWRVGWWGGHHRLDRGSLEWEVLGSSPRMMKMKNWLA